MLRTEMVLGGFFLACWLAALAYTAGLLPAPPPLELNLYGLFTFAAAFGWTLGNLYVLRMRARPEKLRPRRLLGLYLFAPAGLVALVRAMTDEYWRRGAPLGGLLALAIYSIFFFVPVLLKRRDPRT